MALVSTPGASNADSYVSLAEANAYFADRLQAEAWSQATDPEKEAALKWACRTMDTRLSYEGVIVSTTQRLPWPRYGVVDPSRGDGSAFVWETVPDPVKWAQCELALALLQEDRTLDPDMQGISSLTVGPISITSDGANQPGAIPKSVSDLLSGIATMRVSSSVGSVRVVRS